MSDDQIRDHSDEMEQDLHQLEDHLDDAEKQLQARKADADPLANVAGDWEGKKDDGNGDDPVGAEDDAGADDDLLAEEAQSPT